MSDQPENVETQPTPIDEIKLVFKSAEVNLILSNLSELPYKVSGKLINNILMQAQSQLNPSTTE